MTLNEYIKSLQQLRDENAAGEWNVVTATINAPTHSVVEARSPRAEELRVRSKRESYDKLFAGYNVYKQTRSGVKVIIV